MSVGRRFLCHSLLPRPTYETVLRFAYFQGTYSGPDAGLSFIATVKSGKCHGLGFLAL
jgi:hypothetical protein